MGLSLIPIDYLSTTLGITKNPHSTSTVCVHQVVPASSLKDAGYHPKPLLHDPLSEMAPIFTKKKIEEFLAAGNDIAIPVLSLVKDASGALPPLHYAAIGALFIASNVKVSSVCPKC